MTTLFSITEETIKPFEPLLTQAARKEFLTDKNTLLLGAERDGRAAAVALLRVAEEVYYLQHFAVDPSLRRQGIGTEVLGQICEICAGEDVCLIAEFYSEDTSEGMYPFLENTGVFTLKDTGHFRGRVTEEQVKAFLDKLPAGDGSTEVVPFGAVPQRDRDHFAKSLEKKGDLLIDISDGEFVDGLCLCAKDEKDILAAVFVKQVPGEEKDCELAFLWSGGNQQKALTAVLSMAATGFVKLGMESLYLSAVSEQAIQMIRKRFPECEILGRYYMASWDYIPV